MMHSVHCEPKQFNSVLFINHDDSCLKTSRWKTAEAVRGTNTQASHFSSSEESTGPSPQESQVQHLTAHWFHLVGPALHFHHNVKITTFCCNNYFFLIPKYFLHFNLQKSNTHKALNDNKQNPQINTKVTLDYVCNIMHTKDTRKPNDKWSKTFI